MKPRRRNMIACLALLLSLPAIPETAAQQKKGDKTKSAKPAEPPRERYWTFRSRQFRIAPEDLKGIDRRFHLDYVLPLAASGDALFFTSRIDHRIGCLDAATGKPRWTFTADAGFFLAPTHDAGKVYAGCDDGNVYCLDAKTGKLIWKSPPPAERTIIAYGKIISAWPVRTNVHVEEGVAYIGRGIFPHDGTFVEALNAQTGERLWRNSSAGENPYEWSALSPAGYLKMVGDQLLVPNDEMGVRLFFKADGRTVPIRRRLRRWPHFPTMPVTEDGRRFVSTYRGEIYCEGPPERKPANPVELDEPIVKNPFGNAPKVETAADAILQHSGVSKGYAFVLDCEKGALALALARKSELLVYAIFSDEAKASVARDRIQRTGLYGRRITIRTLAPGVEIPYPARIADLIVSEGALGGALPGDLEDSKRLVKPIRGVALDIHDKSCIPTTARIGSGTKS